MGRVLGLGVAQLACAAFDTAGNAERGAAAIARAAADGASLVVLPELASTGYLLDRDRLAAAAEEVAAPGACLRAWAQAARAHGVAVVAGFAERDGDRLYNAVMAIGADGAVAGVYRKLHLFGGEAAVFAPGDLGLPLFELAGARVGIQVCYDLRFPEVMRILALQGAEVVAVPTAWVAGFDRTVPDHGYIGQVAGALVQANLNQVYVACADQVGAHGGVALLGRSVVADPYGDAVVGPLSATEPDLVVAQVDVDAVRRARHRGAGIDPLENRRTDVYAPLLGYVAPPVLEHLTGGSP